MHIGIAGAGLLGRLFAFELARAGHRVEVFDPAADAETRTAAGWTAAGMLSPVAELVMHRRLCVIEPSLELGQAQQLDGLGCCHAAIRRTGLSRAAFQCQASS